MWDIGARLTDDPSELIVYDAYHRVVHYELIDGREGAQACGAKGRRARPLAAGGPLARPDWAQTGASQA